jgi:hypothetical protein
MSEIAVDYRGVTVFVQEKFFDETPPYHGYYTSQRYEPIACLGKPCLESPRFDIVPDKRPYTARTLVESAYHMGQTILRLAKECTRLSFPAFVTTDETLKRRAEVLRPTLSDVLSVLLVIGVPARYITYDASETTNPIDSVAIGDYLVKVGNDEDNLKYYQHILDKEVIGCLDYFWGPERAHTPVAQVARGLFEIPTLHHTSEGYRHFRISSHILFLEYVKYILLNMTHDSERNFIRNRGTTSTFIFHILQNIIKNKKSAENINGVRSLIVKRWMTESVGYEPFKLFLSPNEEAELVKQRDQMKVQHDQRMREMIPGGRKCDYIEKGFILNEAEKFCEEFWEPPHDGIALLYADRMFELIGEWADLWKGSLSPGNEFKRDFIVNENPWRNDMVKRIANMTYSLSCGLFGTTMIYTSQVLYGPHACPDSNQNLFFEAAHHPDYQDSEDSRDPSEKEFVNYKFSPQGPSYQLSHFTQDRMKEMRYTTTHLNLYKLTSYQNYKFIVQKNH